MTTPTSTKTKMRVTGGTDAGPLERKMESSHEDQPERKYTVKKVSDIPIPSRDVTYHTLSGRE
jgi:hypothetical protein